MKYGNEHAPIFGEGRLLPPVPQLFLDSAWNAGFIHESAAPDGSLPVAFPHASGERRHSIHRQRYFVLVTAAMYSNPRERSALICDREYAWSWCVKTSVGQRDFHSRREHVQHIQGGRVPLCPVMRVEQQANPRCVYACRKRVLQAHFPSLFSL